LYQHCLSPESIHFSETFHFLLERKMVLVVKTWVLMCLLLPNIFAWNVQQSIDTWNTWMHTSTDIQSPDEALKGGTRWLGHTGMDKSTHGSMNWWINGLLGGVTFLHFY
jgi:hypothetical protein